MKIVGKSHLVTLVIGLVIGAIALGAVQAAISVTSEVRIGVRRLDDGRIEVGLQQMTEEEGWQDLETAPARFLPEDADIDQWRYSTAIEVTATVEEEVVVAEVVAEEVVAEEVVAEESVVVVQPRRPVMCVLGHAYPAEDRFWQWTLAAANVAAYQYGVDMVLYGARDSAEHANDIRDCISHEPITIATSLPYAEDLEDVLAEAQAAGIQVVSFNSGAEDAASVGSLIHIGLDDFGGGVRAGDEFDEAGVSGTLVCVIHEDDNIGLHDRCDGIAQSYDGGDVETMSVDQTGVADPEATQALIAGRIAAGDLGGILTLNHDSGIAAIDAIEAAGVEIALASFGFSDELADAVRDGKMMFIVWDHPVVQGYLAVSAMAMAYTLELSQLNAEVFLNGAKILIEPTLADKDRAAELKSMFAGPPPSPQAQTEDSADTDTTQQTSDSEEPQP